MTMLLPQRKNIAVCSESSDEYFKEETFVPILERSLLDGEVKAGRRENHDLALL